MLSRRSRVAPEGNDLPPRHITTGCGQRQAQGNQPKIMALLWWQSLANVGSRNEISFNSPMASWDCRPVSLQVAGRVPSSPCPGTVATECSPGKQYGHLQQLNPGAICHRSTGLCYVYPPRLACWSAWKEHSCEACRRSPRMACPLSSDRYRYCQNISTLINTKPWPIL